MTGFSQRASSERGAVFIHIALSLIVLLMFVAFVADYGMLMVSRNQAQNAADSAALAGARALANDADADIHDRARNVAWNVGVRNVVWGAEGSVVPTSPYAGNPCSGDPDSCIRVEVYRDGNNGSASMSTWFASLFGITTQGIRASAVAEVGSANTSDCLKPFAIPDSFTDTGDVGFDPGIDTYSPLGYTLAGNLGDTIMIRQTDETRVAPGWFRLLDLVGGGGGGTSDLRDVIMSCAADPKGVGDELTPDSGVKNGIKQAVDALLALDPDAQYDPTSQRIVNSCADDRSCDGYIWNPETGQAEGPEPDPGRNYSPRILPLAVFDPEIMATEGRIVVVNILGFFLLDDYDWTGPNKYLKGVIINQPGLFDRGKGTVPGDSAFTKIIRLVR